MSNEIKIGGCLCGKVEYEFDSSKVISAHHCHCKDCQKSTGSGKATIVMIPEEDLNFKWQSQILHRDRNCWLSYQQRFLRRVWLAGNKFCRRKCRNQIHQSWHAQ